MSLSAGPWLETMIGSNLRVALLIGLVYGALTIVGRHSGSSRHAVWLTAIGGCLALPWIGAMVPSLPVPILPPVDPVDPVAAVLPSSTASAAIGNGLAAGPLPATIGRAWLLAYLIGAGAVLGHFIVSITRIIAHGRSLPAWPYAETVALKDALCRELRIGREVRLLQGGDAGSPFTWGALRPRVVLPARAGDWPPERMRNVLLHELCHVRRLDWLRLCLMRLAASVYWLNPLIWIAIRECRYEAERACDDFVLGAGGRSFDYAEQLVDLMASGRAADGLGMALGDSAFSRRIRAILNSTQEARVMSRSRARLATTATATSAVLLAACQVTSGQPVHDEQAQAAEIQAREEQPGEREALERQVRELEAREVEAREVEARQLEMRERERELEARAQQALVRVQEEERRLAVRREAELTRLESEARAGQRLLEERARVQAEEQRLAALAEMLALRSAVASREARMESQQRELEELRAVLDQQGAVLAEKDRALAALEAELETLRDE
jgi:beta-lactamase regulating signal transducer with metallopeptidase domain